MFKQQLADTKNQLAQLIEKDINAFNIMLREKQIPIIFTDIK
jgi:hypothetical protein